PVACGRRGRPPVELGGRDRRRTGRRKPLERQEGSLVRAATTRARGRGPLRLPRGRAVPAPAAVRAVAPGPRSRLLRVRAARPADAVRPRRRPCGPDWGYSY